MKKDIGTVPNYSGDTRMTIVGILLYFLTIGESLVIPH